MENEAFLLEDIFENGSASSLKELFILRTARWKYWLMNSECWTGGRFDDLEQKLYSDNAFDLIPTAVEICLTQADPDLFDTALSLLASLARASNTTEMPNSLREQWGAIELKAREIKSKDCQTFMGYLEDWYRKTL
jgi:hypothetical protein